MYKIILISILLISASLKAQNGPASIFSNTVLESREQINLSNSVRSSMENPALYSGINLIDFKNIAQKGLDYMSPGSKISNVKCVRITNWSETISNAFHTYLTELRKDDIAKMSPASVEELIVNKLSEFSNGDFIIGNMSWEIRNDHQLKRINSVAVFDNKGNVVFDTELVNFVRNVIPLENQRIEFEADNNSPNSAAVIVNQRSGSMTYSYVVEGTFDDVTHYNKVTATAIVPPYITAATNDAFLTPRPQRSFQKEGTSVRFLRLLIPVFILEPVVQLPTVIQRRFLSAAEYIFQIPMTVLITVHIRSQAQTETTGVLLLIFQ
ncbi:MAG: hypothetical protein IPM96_21850 [Ignavibacteria bacterium]|nr:hypothetical protein [Ignavibacteria bacterium]